MRFTALICASVLAIGCLGCGEELGWGPIGTREGQAEQPPPASRGKEVRELCAEVGMVASSALCNDMDQLKKKKKTPAKH